MYEVHICDVHICEGWGEEGSSGSSSSSSDMREHICEGVE